jgi:hypothetical protein
MHYVYSTSKTSGRRAQALKAGDTYGRAGMLKLIVTAELVDFGKERFCRVQTLNVQGVLESRLLYLDYLWET